MGEIFSSDGEQRRREDRARAQIRADQEQRRRDLEESERRAEEERRQYDRERRREQERLEALQRLEDALRMELRQRELERQLAAQAEKDRIEKIIRDLILTAEEEFKVGKEELRKEHQSVMRKIREFHKNALEMKRIDFKLAEGILSVAIDGIKEMMKIDKEEHRSEIKRHELTKREMVEKHQETILSEILLTSTFEEDMQEHELQHQLKLENIEKKSEIDKANFDKAVRADILENKFNRAVQRTKRAGCSLSDAMEILNESIGSLQDEDGEQTLTRARNRQIGITRVNHGLNDLSEAAENILRLHGLDVEEDSTNKEISTQILDDIGTARECLSQLVNSDEETLLETFQMLSEKTSFLSSLAVDILLEIALQNHVVNAIEKSNLELFECCTGAIED
ncbi:Protein containing ALS2cr12 (ALS2CR12) signature [Caenorhabditis elegans]|uniref:Protein containing ALS2cr12 (ALS2CR12) signature n=1 Tax=Caenorhabditis elegans TaxID=6239 RepID=Q2L6U3_CAEEL|nr:Protein containing ALS2cr12 (ALS2CR12) signature [Caenorhabditis elegans]CAJ58495.1 Protein containing ALS2cr12 (ALS2CR12) signature [Caenorhabditis elegans]|eukprot:NP_001040637.1 Protein containing ALS2cr12 (ALS2CR12) signature [Caenorhabditis elegans]